MRSILINLIVKLGINKAIFKLSLFTSMFSTIATNLIVENKDIRFLGTTVFLWVIYSATVILDWVTGLSAAHYVAREKGEKFRFDFAKSFNNIFKHALFIVIMSALYFFKKESSHQNFPRLIEDFLSCGQYIYFIYQFINEFISIENNRYLINGKHSRLYKILVKLLDSIDKKAAKELDKFSE